jgi:drug/metabolite transporter (DMT)-like permease
MWLLLLCFHLVGLVGYNLLLRKSNLGRVDKFALATIAQTGIALPALVLLVIRPPQLGLFSAMDWIFIIATVVLTIALQVTNVKALQYLEASVFSVIYNIRIILTTLLGIFFLNEDVVWLRIAGGCFILLAIVIVRQKGSQLVRKKGIMWAIAAALALSFLNLFEKKLINHVGFINYFPIESVVSGVVMWMYLVSSKRSVGRNLLLQPRMLQLMTLRAVSAYGYSGALAAGALISVASYISGMSVIFVVLLGAIWLGERDYLRRKIMATVVAVAGLTLVLLSGIR